MYLDIVKNKQGAKVYIRHLLRESYREGKKVKHRTIANLSHCSPDEIEAVCLALKHKKQLTELLDGATKSTGGDTLKQGLSVGAVWVITDIACQIGITTALGNTNEGKLTTTRICRLQRYYDRFVGCYRYIFVVFGDDLGEIFVTQIVTGKRFVGVSLRGCQNDVVR